MDTCSLDELSRRIAALERRCALLQRGVGALLAVLFGLVVFRTDAIRPHREVVAGRFVVRDDDGRDRARLSAKADGSTELALLDDRGREAAALATQADGGSTLQFSQKDQVRLALQSSVVGGSLGFFNPLGRGNAGLYLDGEGASGVSLRRGLRGVDLLLRPDGSTTLDFQDGDGRPRQSIGLAADDSPRPLGRVEDVAVGLRPERPAWLPGLSPFSPGGGREVVQGAYASP